MMTQVADSVWSEVAKLAYGRSDERSRKAVHIAWTRKRKNSVRDRVLRSLPTTLTIGIEGLKPAERKQPTKVCIMPCVM